MHTQTIPGLRVLGGATSETTATLTTLLSERERRGDVETVTPLPKSGTRKRVMDVDSEGPEVRETSV